MALCEYCGMDKPDAHARPYSAPQVIDAAAAAPTPTGEANVKNISICNECDRLIRQGDSNAVTWLEKQLGEPL